MKLKSTKMENSLWRCINMKYLGVQDVECIMCFNVFNSKQDKIDFVEYLYWNKLISARTKDTLLKEIEGNE